MCRTFAAIVNATAFADADAANATKTDNAANALTADVDESATHSKEIKYL